MQTGFNTNVPLKGKVYHIQTEDGGEKSAQVVTLLYHEGTILARTTGNYAELLVGEGWEPQVHALMKKQHIDMIKSLISGDALRASAGAGQPGSPETA